MLSGIHYDANCASALMVDLIAVLMVISYTVNKVWTLEHFDVKSAFLHENHLYHKPVCIREAARAYGTFKNGKTIGILIRSL